MTEAARPTPCLSPDWLSTLLATALAALAWAGVLPHVGW